jgi:phosphoribosyl 1,2-cyclic phosphodiesterase
MIPGKEEKPLITFWGTRGMITTPGRITEKYGGNTPCVTVTYGDTTIILDVGTGMRPLGIELIEDFYREEQPVRSFHLFLSHTHWDHIQGIPYFLRGFMEEAKLTIHGSPHKERYIESVLKNQMDAGYFPVSMSDVAADVSIQDISEEVIDLGSVVVDWQEQHLHPGGSVRYRLNVDGKRIVYATDVELNLIFGPDSNEHNKEALAREYHDFIYGADLLIADGQYTEEEYSTKVGWGHTSISLLLEIASQSKVKQLAVFHHDPQHSDRFLDALSIESRSKYRFDKGEMEFFWAREGMTLAV